MLSYPARKVRPSCFRSYDRTERKMDEMNNTECPERKRFVDENHLKLLAELDADAIVDSILIESAIPSLIKIMESTPIFPHNRTWMHTWMLAGFDEEIFIILDRRRGFE